MKFSSDKVVPVFQILIFFLISTTLGFDPRQDLGIGEVEERECVGTASGFSSSGTPDFRYNQLRKRYLGCTYVLGNLEITHLDEPRINYDLSFLQHIRYVSGYVLIGLVGEVDRIPLTSLEIVRGNHTFSFQGQEYSLMVALTSRDLEVEGSPAHGLKTLMMPKLKEISRGKVIFIQNPALGYIDTVNWEPIMKGRLDVVHFGQEPYNLSASNKTDSDMCYGGGMWGGEESLCQEVIPYPMCDETCGTLCYGPGPADCCHDTCAVGCSGPTSSECTYCKDFMFEGKCMAYCPEMTYQLMQECIAYQPLNPL